MPASAGAGISAPELLNRFIDAVDVWSWVLPGTEVCFRANSSKLLFIDTTVLPRAIGELPAYRISGRTCGLIDRAGQVVLMPGPPAPPQSLSDCMVRTTGMLNFRDGPAGDRITGFRDFHGILQDWLPPDVTLTVLERTAGWFKVDYHGTQGWISADYVIASGDCAQDM